jgi:elongation factor 2
MPKFKQTNELLSLMDDKEHIRNIGIIAHIDHGKTTMSDSLLAMAGFMAPERAGETRALDFLEEEQRRGITIKTANISLLYEEGDQPYVINLIDTPGHVDFSGKVTRALRALDGCILLVKPVMYINKFDRLIKELKMDADAVMKKLMRVINQFNTIVQTFGEDAVRNEWTVNAANGTVAFGSALDRWGFTLPQLKEKGLTFKDIVDFYKNGELEKLQELLPLPDAIFSMAVHHLPNPVESQPFRLEKIWQGDIESPMGQSMVNLDDDGPLVVAITNVLIDPQAGVVSTGRIFSGTIRKGQDVYLLIANKQYKIQQVAIYMGQYREIVEEIPSGNLVALLGLDQGRAGETLVNMADSKGAIGFESIKYISDPVLTVAVEPKRPTDLARLIDAMQKLSIQDPNLVATINQETGEYLLSGMGELHLEIAIKDLGREHRLDVTATEPTVVYRETIQKAVGPFMGKSPNKHNRVWFDIEPTEPAIVELIRNGELSELSSRRQREMALRENAGWSVRDSRRVVSVGQNANLFTDFTTGIQGLREVLQHMAGGFQWSIESGPFAGEAVRGIHIKLKDAQLHEDPVHRGPAQMMPAARQAIFAGILSAEPTLLEPIYKIQVRIPPDELGSVTGLLSRKRGSIHNVEQSGPAVTVTGMIPVSETLGLSQEMRAATSGSAFWQSTFDHWSPIPQTLLMDTVRKVRTKKGMEPDPPHASRYIVRE